MPTQTARQPIRVLAPLVANQIAAGEVVERPASVVKELMENAIDAGAATVTIEIEQGGIELIRVTDDGGGIPAPELALALAPHATSKVTHASDLERIATLGFRGEALASIASVSRLALRSRTPDDEGAAQVDAEGDVIAAPRPAAGPCGTSVSVRTLFFNTPARRKFLRTVPTEQERCGEVVKQLALAHPALGVRFLADGRELILLAPGQSPRERALAVLGKELGPQLLDVHADQFDDSRGIALWGLAGMPAIARGSSKHQFVFVNGRAVKDRTIQHAIAEAYRGLIDPSRYPTVLLMLELSPEGVDVNVHPQKAEVRFRDSSLVHSVVLRSLRAALQRADLTPRAATLAPSAYASPVPRPLDLPGPSEEFLPAPSGTPAAQAGAANPIGRFVEFFTRRAPQQPGISYSALRESITGAPPSPESHLPAATARDSSANPALPPVSIEPAARVLQVHKSYLVTQDDQGVVIIDQHALHERVMFEYLLARVMNPASGRLESQRLLAPVTVPATAAQVERLATLGPLLDRLGVSAEPMGPRTVGVHAFPTFLFDRGVDPVEFMTDLLEKTEDAAFADELVRGGEAAMRDVLDMMSCKAAVKAGDALSESELGELARLRYEVERSSSCPHGRPTSVRLTIKDLEKLFGRA